MDQARQLGNELGIARRLGQQLAPQPLRAHLVQHPFFEEGLGRAPQVQVGVRLDLWSTDRKSTRLNSSHLVISYAVFCLKKKKQTVLDLRRAHHPPSRSRVGG